MKKLNAGFLILDILGMCFFSWILKPSSVGFFIFSCFWLSMPAITLIFLSMKKSHLFITINNAFYVSFAVIGSGIYFLIDVTYLHPDPQGALAVYMLPMVQMIEIGLLAVVFNVLRKRRNLR